MMICFTILIVACYCLVGFYSYTNDRLHDELIKCRMNEHRNRIGQIYQEGILRLIRQSIADELQEPSSRFVDGRALLLQIDIILSSPQHKCVARGDFVHPNDTLPWPNYEDVTKEFDSFCGRSGTPSTD